MHYKLLGTSGLRVSELCLGSMTFGQTWEWGASKAASQDIFEEFVEAGGNFIDTANFYMAGESEKLVGEFIASDRERFVLSTKYSGTVEPGDPNRAGNQRKNMVRSLDESLKRLKTDYVDIYYLHAWDFLTPVEEVMRAFDDLVRSGKVHYLGISDTPAWIVAQANTLVQRYGWTPFSTLTTEYNLIERTSERELLPMAQAFGLGVTAWSPLAHGVLSGKYTRNEASNGVATASAARKRLDSKQFTFTELSERNHAIVRMVQQVADESGYTPSQVALAWLRAQSKDIIPIISASNVAQFRENLACLDLTLSPQHLTRLNKASHISTGFPLDFLARDDTRNLIYAGMFDAIDTDRHAQLLRSIEQINEAQV